MHSIVLIKQVPNTTQVKLDPKTGNLIREGLDSIINPDDRHALEAAVALKDKHGGSVTALSMGPPQAVEALTEAIGLGADKAILLCDQAFAGADTWATSFTLSRAIQTIGSFDLIICGRQAIDGDTAQIGPQVADWLSLPQVTGVFSIESLKAGVIEVKQRTDNGFDHLECPLPALLSVGKEINAPRHPNMGSLIHACTPKAPITVWNAADIGVTTDQVGLEGSLTHVIKTFAPDFKRRNERLEGTSTEIVTQLIQRLKASDVTFAGRFNPSGIPGENASETMGQRE